MIPDSTFLSELNMSDRLREMLNRALDRRNHYADCRTQGSNYWARCDCESPLKDKRYKAATFGTVKDVTIEQLSALIGRGVAGSEDVARERSRELLRKQIKGWQARIKGMRKAIKTNQAKIVSLKAELELLG
jgi:hypothetical protein